VVWFRVFAGFQAAFAFVVAFYGLARVMGWDVQSGMTSPENARPVEHGDWAVLPLFFALGLVMLSAAFIKPAPSNWGAGLAVLILGLPCCLAPSLILLVFWCQPPTRLYFATHGWKTLPPPMPPPPIG
jgi:hypothetical protein